MPTYVYKFVETGETIEVQQSFTDSALTEAEHPGTGVTMAVKKVFTPVGVTFRGDGFYKTDSRGKSGAKSSESSADGGSGGTDSTSSSSSTKADSSKADSSTKTDSSKSSDSSKTSDSSSSSSSGSSSRSSSD